MEVQRVIEKRQPQGATCVACRLSKIKCEAADTSSSCKRCLRLGLSCQYSVSKRGQANVKRDVARLGPAVRALLAETSTKCEPAAAFPVLHESTHDVNDHLLCWDCSRCQRQVADSISTHEGKIALIKHWLLIGVRSGSCGLLGNVLILAHSFGLRLQDFKLEVAPQASLPLPVLPSYIMEWFNDPFRACCVRQQSEGSMQFEANLVFRTMVAEPSTLQAQVLLPTLRLCSSS